MSKKIRLGALNVGEYSFWPIWAEALIPQGTLGTSLLNMEITHCWDVNPQLAAEFAAKYNCQPVDQYDAMLGQVDAIAFGGFYEIPWQHLLARPYVEAGVPTYLSRPFAYRLCDLDQILDLAAKHNTPLMATSVFEHFPHANILKNRLADLGVIKSVYGNCCSNEYPAHFHIQFFLLKALGYEPDQVSLLTDDERQCTYLQDTILFKGTDDQPPFLATLHTSSDTPHLHLYVVGDKGDESIEVSRSTDPKETLYHFFAPQLLDMQRAFQGEPYQSFDLIRKKTQMFLAGYYSHLEKGGSFVALDSVPLDWSPRHYKPGWIDESMFQG
jgi:predicted dehydrogenase